jgi:hypothetical protein
MTIGIITTNFMRVPILEIFAEGITRLREETGLAIPCVCVGDSSGAETCRIHGIQHIEYPNKPLTAKFNRACMEMQKIGVNYVMVMGSDDLISTETFLRIKEETEKDIDLIGLSDVYFFGMDDVFTNKLVHFKHTTVLGVGRTISARVLDQINWQPWNIPRDRAIDTVMLDYVRPFVQTRVLLDGGFVVDLKTSWNLNPIKFWFAKLGYMPNNDLLWKNIGIKEKELINNFIDK